jgi:hypothetical protein
MRSIRFAVCVLVTMAMPLVAGCGGGGEDDSSGAGSQDVTAAKPKTTASAKATRFRQLKSGPTEKNAASISTAGGKIDNSLVGSFKFLKPTNEGSDAGARETRIKEVMHRFMCSFFDDSIDIAHRSGAASAKKAIDDLDMGNNVEGDAGPISAAITAAVSDPDLDVMSGTASGNNTFGNVLGVYDKKNNEITFFGFSNCGSDN